MLHQYHHFKTTPQVPLWILHQLSFCRYRATSLQNKTQQNLPQQARPQQAPGAHAQLAQRQASCPCNDALEPYSLRMVSGVGSRVTVPPTSLLASSP